MIRFMVRSSDAPPPAAALPDGFTSDIWRPSLWSWTPEGVPVLPTAVWTALHHARVFANRDLGMVLIRSQGQVVHSLLVTPRWYRFPFMRNADVQIGAVFTAPAFRGRGLARVGISLACMHWRRQGRDLWYLTEGDNEASIRAASACGFRDAGTGHRTTVAGLSLLGQYVPAAPDADGTYS
jgi:RimJ/RimL family protein N-acetyltransferase